MDYRKKLEDVLSKRENLKQDISRKEMIEQSVKKRECLVADCGALAVWTGEESTGRSPKDTYIVDREEIHKDIDWTSSYNIPLSTDVYDSVFQDALDLLETRDDLYITNRVVGADPLSCLPVTTITDKAVTALFTDNMFRPVPENVKKSNLYDKNFTLIALPFEKLDKNKYKDHFRKLDDGTVSDLIVVMDLENSMGVIIGSAYSGSVKKLIFTVMNYYLPGIGELPVHASANEGADGRTALFLGLSGTGKTTLSADPERSLLGDDEHGWSSRGLSNFENGCYAKLINLDSSKEPDIYDAVMHRDDVLNHGVIVENAMIYPDGFFDLYDSRFTENSRASYPLCFLNNIKQSSTGDHPSKIIFLTADANGVLPPVAKLDKNQAMLWFLMGYTSKLAGTETGIKEPVTTFSRFFGEPFMPRNPDVYAELLGRKMEKSGTEVFLVNTGWTGGCYGAGKRMDINITRKIVSDILNSDLNDVEYEENKSFHVNVPKSFPGIDAGILNPRNTWLDKKAFDLRAAKLAAEFSAHFDKSYSHKNLSDDIRLCCPGK